MLKTVPKAFGLKALIVSAVIFGLSANAYSETKEIFLTAPGGGISSKFDVDSGGRIDRFIANMANRTAGTLDLKAGFHVDSGFGEFVRLRLEVKKGNETIQSSDCYSIHSPTNFTPKCNFRINISTAIAEADGNYTLSVHNNSGKRVKDFAISKQGFDPLMPDFKSTFTNICRPAIDLTLEGGPIALAQNSSVVRNINGVLKTPGSFALEFKWHTATLIPNVFLKLKVELLRPDGTVAVSRTDHSIHAPADKAKLFIFYTSKADEAAASGKWKLRVTNSNNERIEGFDMQKGNDPSPFVPRIKSTFKEICR